MGSFMEINLTYNSTYEFTTADFYSAADPPITFESNTRLTPEWARLIQAFLDTDKDNLEDAIEITGVSIVSVSQDGGPKFPVGNVEGAWALHAAIEKTNPGQGDDFIIGLVRGHYHHHFRKIVDLSGNSEMPSPPSDDGNNQNE